MDLELEIPDPHPVEVGSAYARPVGVCLVLAGVAHLLAPRVATRVVGRAYDLVLDVRFEPGDRTPRRIRAVGVALVLAGAHLAYHGGVDPRG